MFMAQTHYEAITHPLFGLGGGRLFDYAADDDNGEDNNSASADDAFDCIFTLRGQYYEAPSEMNYDRNRSIMTLLGL